MESIWLKACQHYDVPEDVAKNWFTKIKEKLSESTCTRSYHNWNEMMLRKEILLAKCKPSVVIAAFFQYYNFDGVRSCTEENCETFKEFCRESQWEDESTKMLILNLLGDKTEAEGEGICCEIETNILQDLDLAILAANVEDYKVYSTLLRKQYARMSDDTFRQMRLRVLKALLMIPNIYATPDYRTQFEEKARANIQCEIDDLMR